MFESPLPLYEDVRKAFQQQQELSGFVTLERLPRLKDIADFSAGGETNVRAEAQLQFRLGPDKQRQITGRVSMALPVRCQRCLEPVTVELDDVLALVVLAEESLAKELDSQWDPWVEPDIHLDLAAIVEEQLVLSVPIVSMHRDPVCTAAITVAKPERQAGAEEAGGENPFAVLAELKQPKSD